MVTLDQAGAGIPTIRIHPSPPALRPWVEHLWLETFADLEPPRHAWRIVPDPSAHVLYHRSRADARERGGDG